MTVTIIETTTTEACVEAALAWAQEHGYEGDRLPKGQRYTADRCPLAKATGFVIDPTNGGLDRDCRAFHPFGELVRVFVSRFDRGQIPEFDLEAHDG